ncbi:hypothetical protein D3C76_1405230 [compost metagenome]
MQWISRLADSSALYEVELDAGAMVFHGLLSVLETLKAPRDYLRQAMVSRTNQDLVVNKLVVFRLLMHQLELSD